MRPRALDSVFAFCLLCASSVCGQGTAFHAPPVPPRGHYTIDCRIDPKAGSVSGREIIRLRNDGRDPLRCVAFDWRASTTRKLTVAIDGSRLPLLDGAEVAGKPISLVRLPSPLEPGAKVELEVTFSTSTASMRGRKEVRLTDWHPRLWWGFPTHGDFDVGVEIPAGYALVTSGRPEPGSGRYQASGIRSFGLFFAQGLEMIESDAEGVLVRCVFRRGARACARLLLETAVDAIRFYREYFGFYPSSSLSIIPGADRPMGGYPFATNMVVIHGQQKMAERKEIHWRWITAHEIGHQYWLEHVLSKDVTRDWGWLMIGLGVHADREYARSRGLSTEKQRSMLQRYVTGVRQYLDTTAELTPEQRSQVRFDFNNVVVHGKGFGVISALDFVLGDETFKRVVLRCQKEYAGRRLGTDAFRAIAEAESGRDLGWFFQQWVRSNRYLSYRIASKECVKEGTAYVTRIAVERVGTLQMPVPVVARFSDGTSQHARTDRLQDVTRLRFESGAPLKEVVLDPDGVLPMVVPPPTLRPAELARRISAAPWTNAGREAGDLYSKAREIDLDSSRVWLKLGMMLYDGERYPEALDAFTRTEKLVAKTNAWSFAACVWQGHVLDLLGRREEAVTRYQVALERSEGNSMQHDQYGMKLDQKWVEERLNTPFSRK